MIQNSHYKSFGRVKIIMINFLTIAAFWPMDDFNFLEINKKLKTKYAILHHKILLINLKIFGEF